MRGASRAPSPLLRFLAAFSAGWLGLLVGFVWLDDFVVGAFCADGPGPRTSFDPLCSTVGAWSSRLGAAALVGALGFFLAVRAERSRSGRGLTAAAAVVGFVVAGSLGGLAGNALSSANEPIYRYRDPELVERRCRQSFPNDPSRRPPSWCRGPKGRPPYRYLVEYRDPVNLGWALGGGLALGALGAAAGGFLEARNLRRRRRRREAVADRSPASPEGAPAERVAEEDPKTRRRRRVLGRGALLLSVPFAAVAMWIVISCHEGGPTALEIFAFYAAPIAWFLLACFGLFMLNVFRFRSAMGNLVTTVMLAGTLGFGLAATAFYAGFARCFTF
jgi:hypothetical protein